MLQLVISRQYPVENTHRERDEEREEHQCPYLSEIDGRNKVVSDP